MFGVKILQTLKVPLAVSTGLNLHTARFPEERKPLADEQLRANCLVKVKIKRTKRVRVGADLNQGSWENGGRTVESAARCSCSEGPQR